MLNYRPGDEAYAGSKSRPQKSPQILFQALDHQWPNHLKNEADGALLNSGLP